MTETHDERLREDQSAAAIEVLRGMPASFVLVYKRMPPEKPDGGPEDLEIGIVAFSSLESAREMLPFAIESMAEQYASAMVAAGAPNEN